MDRRVCGCAHEIGIVGGGGILSLDAMKGCREKSCVGLIAMLRFIPIQRTITVDLALSGKARVNRGLINQL